MEQATGMRGQGEAKVWQFGARTGEGRCVRKRELNLGGKMIDAHVTGWLRA